MEQGLDGWIFATLVGLAVAPVACGKKVEDAPKTPPPSADASAVVTVDVGGGPKEAKGSLEATCAAIAKTTDASFAKVEALKRESNGKADPEWPDVIPRPGIGACVQGAGGAYAIEVSDGDYRAGTEELPGGLSTMRAKLVFVDAAGTKSELAFEPIDEPGGPNFGIGVAWGQWWTVEVVHDWNGDGKAEVALRHAYQSPDGSGSHLELYRLGSDEETKVPRLERWPALGDTGIQVIRDEDGDGRLDLFSFEGFYRYVPLGSERPTYPEGIHHFHHAKADGSFESVGDAAKAYYRKTCGTKFVVADIPVTQGTAVEVVIGKAVCARLHGASVSAIRQRIDPFLARAFTVDELDPAEGWLAEVPVSLAD